MIRYNQKIRISKNRSYWHMESDRGDRYEIMPTKRNRKGNMWTEWWDTQNQSDVRRWQKDIMREFANRYFTDLQPWLVWKQNQSYQDAHDIMVARSELSHTWLIATQDDFWCVPTEYGEFTVLRGKDSMGDCTDPNQRQRRFYPVLDAKVSR